jgi:hypothetical protein
VDENEHQQHSRAEECAIEAWKVACRSREVRQRQEWLDHQHHFHHSSIPYPNDWWQTDGRLNIFRDVPTRNNVLVSSNIIGVLSPGSTVVGTEMIYLNAESLERLLPPQDEHAMGVPNQVQLLKLQDNGGYVVFSINGYCYLGPGVLEDYCSPQAWIWKVTYSGGAFVREGLELNSLHIATLPYGSFCRVSRKTISTDGGLSRLWVHAVLPHDEGATPVEGWISEYLNPTSTTGERGPIVQPVPFPVPAVYQVTLQEGALIRSDVELSSKQIGHAPCGAALQIVGRAFSEHPQDQCIERLKLAGNGGWVSVRLNQLPPNDALVFKFLRMDDSFDVDHPGMFHLHAQSDVDQEVNTDFEGADLSSIDESHESSSSSIIRGGVATDGPMRHGYSEGNCIACLSEERNATIVHGETGHIACCLVCARILKAQGKDVSANCCVAVVCGSLIACCSPFARVALDSLVPRLPITYRFRHSAFLGVTQRRSSLQSVHC